MAFSRLALSLLLGLTVSVGWVHAQTLSQLAASNEREDGTDHTGDIISFSAVGSGASGLPRPWFCVTAQTDSVLWLFPNGSALQFESRVLAVQDEVFIRDVPNFGVVLYRGSTHFSPDGEHCCVRTTTNEKRCVTFTPCPTLSPLSNGMISYNATTNMATYTCDTGYTISGATPITCMSDGTSAGTWSPTPPSVICTIVDCGSPPTTGIRSPGTPTSTTYQGTVTYTCVSGYEISTGVTTAMATCMASGTWGPLPTCSLVDCGPPPTIGNGSPGSPTRTTYQGTVTYTCVSGYEVSTGVTMATCLASGMWGPLPTCSRVSCGDPPSGTNATPGSPTSTVYQGIVTYTCVTGYWISSTIFSRFASCMANTMWEPVLTCTIVDCGPPPTIGNGSPGAPSKTTYQETVTYTCNTGYEVSDGVTMATCLASGMWGPLPTCSRVSCGDPPSGNNASPGSPTRTTYLGTVLYTCVSGYEISTGVTMAMATCMANRMWETVPTCVAVDCGDLTDPTNGAVDTSSGTTFMMTATYTCDTGYTLVGTVTRTCQANAMWSLSAPTCTALCPREPLSNGMVTYSSDVDPPPVGTMSSYMCNNGYEPSGTMMRNCVAVSGWSTSLPVCNPVDCNGLPAPSNGAVDTSSGTTFMMTATYTCNTGYNIVGEATRTCGADTIWTPEAPTCTPVDCGPLTVPNGQVSTSSGTTFMNTATYTCDDGYNLNEETTRTCQANGAWSLTAPTCDPVDCGPLNDTANRQVSTSSGTTFMMTATYTCVTGYNIVGRESRTCGANGTSGVWSGEAPVCNLIPLSSGSMAVIANNSALSLAAIGEGFSALTCRTEVSTCCRTQDNNGSNALGGWTGPGGDISDLNTDGFYVLRGTSSISLNLAEGSSEPAGTYCCQVPRDSRASTTHCVMVTVPPVSPPFPVAAVVGGAVGAIVVVILVILLIIFLVLFLRRSRKKQYEPAAKNSGFSTVYTKHSDTDGVATISKDQEPTITGFPSESRGNEGEEVVIKPKVGGHPPPSLTWYHDGRKVTADYATELDEEGGISFPSVEMKHAGVYKLVASGPSGTAEKELQLIVAPEGGEEEVTDEVDLTPIPVDGFGAYVTEQHANGNKKFSNNYSGLGGKEGEHSTAIAKQHKDENRFGNILVYDDNLIILDPIPGQEDCQSDYINASYVDGFDKPNKFIASQGPLPNTLVDFWRMMWQERPPIIVMLTNLKENNKIKCQQYWPDSGSVNYGPFTVTITDQQVLADYTVRNLLLAMKGQSGKPFKTTQFHFTTWPDHGVPDYATPILGFHRRVKSQHKPSRGPLLVHCSAGVGRTGTYIALDNILDQIAAENVVGVSSTIVKARKQRMKMVQTQDQYVFIHDAILESVTCGDTQISAGDLRRQIQKMSSVAPGKTVSGFQYQFQILEQVSPNPNEVNCSGALRHKNLNRGIQYLPIENHRVFLKGEDPGRDYVNAVFVNGYKHQKAYIIAQNPLDSTVRNFWKVIYDRKCAAVVMLTPLSEDGKEACSQYWPESGNVTSFGEFTIDNLGEETNTGFVMRQLSVLNKKTKQTQQIIQIQILGWKSTGACENLKIVTDVNEEVIKVQRRTGNKAIVVHCSDTATRSGMYCSIATTIDRCKTEGVVDVFQVVKALRVHKPGAVPSVDNYKDVFEALLVYLDSFDTYANFL